MANKTLKIRGYEVTDTNGHFLPSPSSLELFNYFLAASGEQTPEQIRWRIIEEIEQRLSPEAALDATLLLDVYLDFRESLRQLSNTAVLPKGLAQRWQMIHQLRRDHFGDTTAATLFEKSEHVIAVDLERRRIKLDPSLHEEEKIRQLKRGVILIYRTGLWRQNTKLL